LDFSPKILLLIALAAGGFVFPPLWLGALFTLFMIWADVRPERIDAEAGRFPDVTSADEDWIAQIHHCLESPAETAFLDAMIKAFDLKPTEMCLEGSGLKLRFQVALLRYRLDFLVDEALVVEIDGFAWHGSPEAIARDAARDAEMRSQGYTILRIPAKVALYDGKKAVELVEGMRAVALETMRSHNAAKVTALKAGVRPQAILGALNKKIDALREQTATLREEHTEAFREQQLRMTEEAAKSANWTACTSILEEIRAEFSPDPNASDKLLQTGSADPEIGQLAARLIRRPENAEEDKKFAETASRLRYKHALLKEMRDLEERISDCNQEDFDEGLRIYKELCGPHGR